MAPDATFTGCVPRVQQSVKFLTLFVQDCRLRHCTAARDHSPLTHKVVLVGNGSRWDCIFFADNNYFCWTGRVLGWEECVPYFHRCFLLSFLGNH